MKKILKTVAMVCAASLVCACAGQGSKKAEEAAAAAEQQAPAAAARLVEVVGAAMETVPQNGTYSATVQANIVNNIASQTAGRIRKVNVEVGDFVAAGQILAEMDRAQLDQAGLKLKNQADELERVRLLLSEGGISQSDFEQLELAYKIAKSTYDNLEENTILRSPVSGVVTARNYDKGDMYAMAQPIFTVQQITPVKVLVGISESDYTKVKRGDKVTLTADALPGGVYYGTVVRLYPVMDPATHTFNVEVQVRNERRELRPGMYVRAQVDFGASQNICVPDVAVQKQQGSGVRNVFVLSDDSTVELRTVNLGRHFDGKYEITSGLAEGELVVVKGQSTLKAGDKVEVAK